MTTKRGRAWLVASMLAAGLGLACGDSGSGDDEASDEGLVCEPGSTIDCACTDGSTATQTCTSEGSGYDACACGDSETGDQGSEGISTDTSTETETGSGTETSTETDTSTSTDTTEGPIGDSPVPEIFHPGDGEVRKINTPIPWIGVAADTEDGDLSGMALVWSSDLDGEFGTGLMFDAALTTVGMHVISLTATDSDGQQGVTTIGLTLEP